MMAAWNLLDEKSEIDIHKSRLLNVEEKPFKRITKRLGAVSSAARPSAFPGDANGTHAGEEQLQEDLNLDFAAFDSSITRLQFLLVANSRERDRYQADQAQILGDCHDVMENNTSLREQLTTARATLAQRKKFDELTERITSNRLLKPREEQIANLAKLEEECAELERESATYSETWKERRDQFNRIMEEGMLLRRQIRDEKEEVDRREGMNEGGDEDEAGERGGQTPRPDLAGSGTPRPDSQHQRADGEAGTPRLQPTSGRDTPARDLSAPDSLKSAPDQHGAATPSASRPGSRRESSHHDSRDISPAPELDSTEKDVDMEESRQSSRQVDGGGETPTVLVEHAGDDDMEVDT